ncbi:MAG TPA: AAA family ATPase, partial [Pseudomonadota bacterium]|nr:AAA family ATPase [Pseudomonadota bacterium]
MTTDSGARNRAVLLQELGRRLTREFLAKDEIIRLLLLSVVAGEHMLIVGPPGTAKSALVRTLAQSLDARYFEYLLTRFSEPNELLGPVDIQAFREGSFRRRTEQMLPEAEIAFLDEIFKASSAILNSLLGLLNERRVQIGAERVDVPLLALFAASNEVPSDDSLAALLDRFLLRVRSQNLEGFHFQQLLRIGLEHEKRLLGGRSTAPSGPSGPPLLSAKDILQLRRELAGRLQFSDEFLSEYKALTAQIRSEGIFVSDRRLIKMLKLCAASALCDGRTEAD